MKKKFSIEEIENILKKAQKETVMEFDKKMEDTAKDNGEETSSMMKAINMLQNMMITSMLLQKVIDELKK